MRLPLFSRTICCYTQAKTGTGKTLCFLIPIVERIVKEFSGVTNGTLALILSPTRELASQIHMEAKPLFAAHKLHVHCSTGGTAIDYDKECVCHAYGQVHALVATPGRIKDHFSSLEYARRLFRVCKMVVVDEIDQLVDLGFLKTVVNIVRTLPAREHRQTLLYSATVSQKVPLLSPCVAIPISVVVSTLQILTASRND